jgi:hypothetical protein
VEDVPDAFIYQVDAFYRTPAGVSGGDQTFYINFTTVASVSDREGGNGYPYRSAKDPRVMVTLDSANGHKFIGKSGDSLYAPRQYMSGAKYTVASGIEARLIEAEAQLHDNDAPGWLTTLNALRTTGTYTGVDTIVVSVNTTVTPPDTTFHYDTAWVAGTGGVGHLGPLQDPGTTDGRVDLLFRERAFWLFATGHRQGDLRRLVRVYQRAQEDVYPTGAYRGGLGQYGVDVTAPIPQSEQANPHFTGCFDRNA